MKNTLLTKSELKIMQSLKEGKLYKEAAFENDISINTVKKHLKNAYRKLGVNKRKDACIELLKREEETI